MTSEPSGRLYSVVTRHWPRIAAGLVVLLGLVELVAGGLTADSGVEFYLMAWAGTTGGLWFLFEKVEKALPDESRTRLVACLQGTDVASVVHGVPGQFTADVRQGFGEKHFTRRCFVRSSIASIVSAILGRDRG